MSQISALDYSKRKNHILQRLELLEIDDFKTKSQLVKELIDITLPVLESGVIAGFKREDTAKYLWQELDKHNVEYAYSMFIKNFPDDLKRKYSKSDGSSHLAHDFIKQSTLPDGTIVKKCECGKYEINGMEAELVQKDDSTIAEDATALLKSEKKKQEKAKKKSIILDANKVTLAYLDTFKTFIKEFDAKCQNPKILKDLEDSMEYKDLAKMCISLQALFEPPLDKMYHEGAAPSIMNQMLDETNFRAPVTMIQKALCYSLQSLTTYRQWAHKLSISPRQHQRIRERLDEWAPKKAEKIIDNVLGSHTCPSCEFNLITLKGNPAVSVEKDPGKLPLKPAKIKYGDKWYEVPKKYEKSKMNVIDIAYEIFSGKLKLK